MKTENDRESERDDSLDLWSPDCKAQESRWAHDQHIITWGGPVGPWGWLFLRLTNIRLIDMKPVPPDHHYMRTQRRPSISVSPAAAWMETNSLTRHCEGKERKIIYISQQANGLCRIWTAIDWIHMQITPVWAANDNNRDKHNIRKDNEFWLAAFITFNNYIVF